MNLRRQIKCNIIYIYENIEHNKMGIDVIRKCIMMVVEIKDKTRILNDTNSRMQEKEYYIWEDAIINRNKEKCKCLMLS